MNSSDTSKLLNQFNISAVEVMRRINRQEQTNLHAHVEDIDSNGSNDEQRDGVNEGINKGILNRAPSSHHTYLNDEIVSTVIDMNSSNAETSAIFNQFNMSKEDVQRKISRINDSTTENDSKRQFIEIFKQKIMSSVDRQNNASQDGMDYQSQSAIHNVAFYPVCSLNNETSWLADNTAKLYFSTHLLSKLEADTFLHNAKLRLKQKDPDQSERPPSTRCDEPVDIIRVTVSVFVKRSIKGGNNRTANSRRASSRRELKSRKRVCTSFTTPKNNNGWIEIDVRQHQQQSHGVSIGAMTFGIIMDIARCPNLEYNRDLPRRHRPQHRKNLNPLDNDSLVDEPE
ncbi:hypothetical protein Bhyg_06362, partial [Pseudolycoriella hygida]